MGKIRLVQFTRAFHLGGTETQVVELLRGLPNHYDLKVAVLDEVGPLLEKVWAQGHIPEAFPLNGSLAKPNTAMQVLRMAHWLMRERVELVHVHDFYATIVAVPAAKLAGAKVIVGRLDLAHWHGRARRALLAALTRQADHVVANAEAIRSMLIDEERVAPERISVIHNGLDLARFDAQAAQGLESALPDTGGEPVVVHVANMNHVVKRQEDLISAVAQVNAQGRPLHGFLVGDGPRRPELQALARELGVTGKVHFLGRRTDVPALYQRGAIGVLCSSAEGLSNAIIEGMAAGLPMVVTRAGGNADLIQDGVRGLVVNPGRPIELAQAFRTLLEDPAKARAFGQQARSFVERELTLEKLARTHDLLYRQVLAAEREQERPVRITPQAA